ncbi:glutamate formimidoyltransferase [Nitrospira moscoviensis]|uniref:Formimidoyltransferase-cyclodeaminase n=1 Tax=Nitrospira moscoviensis TaxID=42253 RepID=A0A0K2GIX2_NITMO|nr:glutamate formimidoyltransferase [Nitrospira moscoviensis]ALA60890.1 putative Formimidoyltransferase-cyclodeaminase [Nitrospira moscoviensis]
MNRIVKCVPNFSEGREPATVHAIVAAVTSVPDVWLLDHSMDADHHRSVVTFIGSPEAVAEAAWRAIQTATRLIDLRRHSGVHPRVGATDVVPFVPIEGVTMDECVQLARRLGRRVGDELRIPVFLYERAATTSTRVRLERIRQGGLPGLRARMESDPSWTPDYGPPTLHDTAGAIVIGARPTLIAFNVNLKSQDLPIAQAIARAVRESTGGLPSLKAIGVPLPSRGLVQVSMNLTDYRVTPLQAAFQAVKTEAAKYGVDIAGSEFIGLVPQEALNQVGVAFLECERFDPAQILETRMRAAMAGADGSSLAGFLRDVAAPNPTPAGGSVAALVGALAAALGVMGARLAERGEAEQTLLRFAERLQGLVQADMAAYGEVARAGKVPKERPERSDHMEAAMHRATAVPVEIAEAACAVGRAVAAYRDAAKPAVRSDLTVALIMALASSEAGLHTAKVNIKLLKNKEVRAMFEGRIAAVTRSLEELRGLCYTPPS